jgi:hypothetical protein
MNPVKFKDLINETAQRVEQPPHLVAAVLNYYFKDLRAAMTNLSHPRIQLLNLGTFQLKSTTIQKKLCAKKQRLKNLSPIHHHQVKEDLEQQIMAIEQALSIIETEKQRKQQFKQNRNHHG